MERRGPGKGPFFTIEDGLRLTREQFVIYMRSSLRQAGTDQSPYAEHSYRIGAAMTATA